MNKALETFSNPSIIINSRCGSISTSQRAKYLKALKEVTCSFFEKVFIVFDPRAEKILEDHYFHAIRVLFNPGLENFLHNLQMFHRIDLQARFNEVMGYAFAIAGNMSEHHDMCCLFTQHHLRKTRIMLSHNT